MNASEQTPEILDLEHAYWKAMKNLDVETAISLTDDVTVVVGAQGHSAMPRESFRKSMNGEKWKLLKYEFAGDPTVKFLAPDIVAIAYKVREELEVEGKRLTLEAADSSVWQRKEGKWRCALHTESLLGDPFGRDRIKGASAAQSDEGTGHENLAAGVAAKGSSSRMRKHPPA